MLFNQSITINATPPNNNPHETERLVYIYIYIYVYEHIYKYIIIININISQFTIYITMDHHGTSPAGRFHVSPPPSNESWRWIQTGPHHKFSWGRFERYVCFFYLLIYHKKSTNSRANIPIPSMGRLYIYLHVT